MIAAAVTTASQPRPATRWYRQLYFYVMVAIVLGVVVGAVWPDVGVAMEPIGTTFVTLMKMLIGPIVFLTIVGGIAGVADLKKVGITGLKALTTSRSAPSSRWPPGWSRSTCSDWATV